MPAPDIEAKLDALNRELDETNQHLTNLIAGVRTSSGVAWEERARTVAPAWSEAESLNANAGTNSLEIKQPGGWVQVPSLEPGTRKVTMTVRIPKSRVSAVQVELAPSPNSGANPAAKLRELLSRPLVKVCGLTRQEDVDAAVEAGADLLGFILAEETPQPRGIDPEGRKQRPK